MRKQKKSERLLALRKEETRLKMLMLRSQYAYHKFLYYEMDNPILTDADFDALEREFAGVCNTIERVYPDLDEIYKPRPWAGYHNTPYGYPKHTNEYLNKVVEEDEQKKDKRL